MRFTTAIPALARRQMVITGDFSGLGVPIYNPFSTTTGADGQTVRTPFRFREITDGSS